MPSWQKIYTPYLNPYPKKYNRFFLKNLFQEKGTELSEFIFYLACREVKENADFLSEEEAKIFIEGLPK